MEPRLKHKTGYPKASPCPFVLIVFEYAIAVNGHLVLEKRGEGQWGNVSTVFQIDDFVKNFLTNPGVGANVGPTWISLHILLMEWPLL